jgi:hypothetical protein
MKAWKFVLNQECAKHLAETRICVELRLKFVTLIKFDER